MHTYFYIITN